MNVICYLPSGYPTIEKSMQIAQLYVDAGCDAIEWCIPPENAYADPPYISNILALARKQCDSYHDYFKTLYIFRKRNPDVDIILLLYQEIIEAIGVDELSALCNKLKINTILSGNLTCQTLREQLMQHGLKIAASINYTMTKDEIDLVCSVNGFVYMQAFPSETDKLAGRDRDTLKKGIALLRELGVSRDIYCGVGIRSPEDIKFIKECGGQGFFLGTALLKNYNDLEKVKSTIAAYRAVAK